MGRHLVISVSTMGETKVTDLSIKRHLDIERVRVLPRSNTNAGYVKDIGARYLRQFDFALQVKSLLWILLIDVGSPGVDVPV